MKRPYMMRQFIIHIVVDDSFDNITRDPKTTGTYHIKNKQGDLIAYGIVTFPEDSWAETYQALGEKIGQELGQKGLP